MDEWCPEPGDLKKYPHIGSPLSIDSIMELVHDPARVARHPFSPFLRYHETYRPFRRKDKNGKPRKKKTKDRPIRYAVHADAYVYGYYRHLLSGPYEALLKKFEISDCVIAYRKIPVTPGASAGKCNIHHAAEAFDQISKLGRCCAVTLDISSYFESIDHEMLGQIWCRLLGVDVLPPDHQAVFNSITNYKHMLRDELYVRLGFAKRVPEAPIKFLRPKRKMPRRLCDWKTFRRLVKDPTQPKLVERNLNDFGIPQGSPISDILANAYLLEFDREMADYARIRGGFYRRYSDDILIVLPGDGRAGQGALRFARDLIARHGEQLRIKPEKCTSACFSPTDQPGVSATRYVSGGKKLVGLEYLGFRFDGRRVHLRNSTVSRFKRKIRLAARARAHDLVARYTGKDLGFLVGKFQQDRFLQEFGRVDFDTNPDARKMTFWSYAKKAAAVLGARGAGIFQQIKSDRVKIAAMVENELKTALQKRP